MAKGLVAEAKRIAEAAGVQQLYVHARARNAAAVALYTRRCGFSMERREAEGEARALGRPPRVLLRCALSPPVVAAAAAASGAAEDPK